MRYVLPEANPLAAAAVVVPVLTPVKDAESLLDNVPFARLVPAEFRIFHVGAESGAVGTPDELAHGQHNGMVASRANGPNDPR